MAPQLKPQLQLGAEGVEQIRAAGDAGGGPAEGLNRIIFDWRLIPRGTAPLRCPMRTPHSTAQMVLAVTTNWFALLGK